MPLWKKEPAACCGAGAAAGINPGVLKTDTETATVGRTRLSAVSLIRSTIKYFPAGGDHLTADGLKKKLLPMSETMFYILSSLRQERHGYGIMLHVKEITQGRIVLGAGTIYQTLQSWKETG